MQEKEKKKNKTNLKIKNSSKKSWKKYLLIISTILITAYAAILLFAYQKNNQPYLKYYKQGEVYLFEKNNIEAINYFTKSIESNPKFSFSYIQRATAFIELKEFDKAVNDLEVILNGNYDDYSKDAANYIKFFAYSKQKDREKAFECLDKALSGKGEFFKTNPTNIAKWYIEQYIGSLLEEKKFKEVENVSFKAIKYFPNDYVYYTALAYVAEKYYHNSESALSYLEKAKKVSNGEITQDSKITLQKIKNKIK